MFLTAIQMFSLYSCQLFGFRKYTLSDLKITVDMNWFFSNLTVKFLPSVFWSDFSFMSVRFALDPKCFLFCISTLCTFRSVFADSWQCLDVISYSCFSTDTDNAGRTHVRSTLTSGLKPFQYISLLNLTAVPTPIAVNNLLIGFDWRRFSEWNWPTEAFTKLKSLLLCVCGTNISTNLKFLWWPLINPGVCDCFSSVAVEGWKYSVVPALLSL